MFFATTKKLSIEVESLYFPTFSAKRCECKIDKRDGHGKLRNDHGKSWKIFYQVCGNPVEERVLVSREKKYNILNIIFIKSTSGFTPWSSSRIHT